MLKVLSSKSGNLPYGQMARNYGKPVFEFFFVWTMM